MHILKYFISFCLCFVLVDSFSQQKPPHPQKEEVKPKETKPKTKKDTIVYKTGYGLRVGLDITKPIRPFFDKSYKGLYI